MNTNGILSFQQPFTDFQSRSFPFDSHPLIAPFWGDVDLVQSGDIFYRETNDSTLLMRVHDNITATLPTEDSFVPTHLFIATWDNVPQYLGDSDKVKCGLIASLCSHCFIVLYTLFVFTGKYLSDCSVN